MRPRIVWAGVTAAHARPALGSPAETVPIPRSCEIPTLLRSPSTMWQRGPDEVMVGDHWTWGRGAAEGPCFDSKLC